jgi:hypothetical protein
VLHFLSGLAQHGIRPRFLRRQDVADGVDQGVGDGGRRNSSESGSFE